MQFSEFKKQFQDIFDYQFNIECIIFLHLYRNRVIYFDKLYFNTCYPHMFDKNWTFLLANIKEGCHYKNVCADFQPRPTTDHDQISIIPKFNLDAKYYSQAFLNPYQKYLEEKRACGDQEVDSQRQRNIFLRKIQEMDQNRNQKIVKFDPMDDTFCSICYDSFESYWKHVNSRSHKQLIKCNQVNIYIHQLCGKYTKTKRCKKQKSKKNSEKTSRTSRNKLKSRINKEKKDMENSDYNPEDFIIKLPFNLLEREIDREHIKTVNFSTGILSNDLKS